MSDFQVRPFAFMRLTHDALRAGFATLQSLAEAGDLDAVAREWEEIFEYAGYYRE